MVNNNYVLLLVLLIGILAGYLISNEYNKPEIKIERTVETVTDTLYLPRKIEAELPAKLDTLWTVSSQTRQGDTADSADIETIPTEIQDVVASADTLLEDSSSIHVEYSYAFKRFKILADIKERMVSSHTKETITKTVYDRGLVYLQIGYGISYHKEIFAPGFYVGVGYSIKIF